MKDRSKDSLAKAIADLKQRGASSGPPQEVVNETLAQLAQARRGAGAQPSATVHVRPTKLLLWSAVRLAAAAAVLVAAGYAFGRITAPQPDMDQLRAELLPSLAASLEPSIRASVVAETTQEYRQAMLASYMRLRDELTEQYRADLDRFAVQTLAASNTLTNQLLRQLMESFATSQRQDRAWVASALEEIQAKRAEENAAFGNALLSFAAETETELQRTREDIVRYLANTRMETPIPNEANSPTMN